MGKERAADMEAILCLSVLVDDDKTSVTLRELATVKGWLQIQLPLCSKSSLFMQQDRSVSSLSGLKGITLKG